METVDNSRAPVDSRWDSVVDGVNDGGNAIDEVDGVDGEVPLPIAGLPPRPPRARVAPASDVSREPVYRRLPNAVHRCDDCMLNHQVDPRAPLALLGRFERRVAAEGARMLCAEHVQHWRDRDALPPLDLQ